MMELSLIPRMGREPSITWLLSTDKKEPAIARWALRWVSWEES
jgi:hypothetical protein